MITSILSIIFNAEIIKTSTSFKLFIKIFVNVMVIFVIGIVFNLAQIFIILFSIFFDYGGINLNSWVAGKIVLLVMIQTKICFLGQPKL